MRYTDETKSVDGYRYAIAGSLACPNGGTAIGGSCELKTAAGTNVRAPIRRIGSITRLASNSTWRRRA
jgi:hypothetical protein